MNIVVPVLRWLVATLKTNPAIAKTVCTGGVWRIYEAQGTKNRAATGAIERLPDNPDFPLIRITWLSGNHMVGNGGLRFASSPRVMIEAVTNSENLLQIVEAADAIDALFASRASGRDGNLIIHGSTCPTHDTKTENANEVYTRLGGFYEFFVYEAPKVGAGGNQ